MYGDTGRFPLIIRHHIKALKYWCRILDLSQSHPVRNAYNMLLELDGTRFTNWCSRIRSGRASKHGEHSMLVIQIILCFPLKIQLLKYLHMSSRDLEIERGRYNDPITPINQRICTGCESNKIDTVAL